MKDRLLEVDVSLLVLRYGRPKVVRMLARLDGGTQDQLERELDALREGPAARRRSRPREPWSLAEIAAQVSGDEPRVAEPLRVIAFNFENGTFLPHLRDVRRFLERFPGSPQTLKSRKSAGPALIRAVAKLPTEELCALAGRSGVHQESDYSILSRAIMGNGGGEPVQPPGE